MDIQLTAKEYRLLVDVLYIADWVLHAFQVGDRAETKPYRDLEQTLLRLAPQMGCAELVEWGEGGHSEKVYHSRRFEDKSDAPRYIEEFEQDTFWDELAHHLAVRDFYSKFTEEEIDRMDATERVIRIARREEEYQDEFEEHGVDRVTVPRKGRDG